MSEEAPKKIVLGFDYDGFPAIGGDTLYIRADLVDELVEALEDIRDYEFSHKYIKDITRAALKKLEENEDEVSPELREGMRKWAEARAINGLKELGRKRNG